MAVNERATRNTHPWFQQRSITTVYCLNSRIQYTYKQQPSPVVYSFLLSTRLCSSRPNNVDERILEGCFRALSLTEGGPQIEIHIYEIILWCQGFGQEFFFVSAQVCDLRNWNCRSNTASFERRLRGAAPKPLALPCPFRTST